jgi:hypothetical protein
MYRYFFREAASNRILRDYSIISETDSEIMGEIDDGLKWKDGYTMYWRVVLTGDYTSCMSEGTRRGRARIYAFCSTTLTIKSYHFKPSSVFKTKPTKSSLGGFTQNDVNNKNW